MAGKTVSEIASKEDSHSEGWASQKGGLIEKEPRVEMLRLLEEAVLDAESHGPDIFFKLDAAGHLF